MATTFFLTNTASIDISADEELVASLSRGAGSSSGIANTSTVKVLLTRTAGGNFLEWFTEPLNAVTISGTITFNVWMSESNMSANVDAEMSVQRTDGAGNLISMILDSAKGVELPVTTRAAQNWTGSPTSTTLAAGDRLLIAIYGGDTLAQASGFTFDGSWGATSGSVDGDTFVTFTEAITEQVVTSVMVPGTSKPLPFIPRGRSM